MVWEISIALIAAAVIALTIYLIITLRYVNSLIRVLHRELAKVHEKTLPLIDEGVSFLKTNQEISKELNRKLVLVDPLFSLIGGLSTKAELALNKKTGLPCECPYCQEHRQPFQEKTSGKAQELGELIFNAFNIYRKIKGG